MFTAFTSYLWGAEDESNEDQLALSVEEITEAEGDWIMVQSMPHVTEKENVGRFQNKGTTITDDLNSECSDHSAVGMDESWFVTPPPCFTGDKKRIRGLLEGNESQLENLLIEHPSMSVYQPQSPSTKLQKVAHNKSSKAADKRVVDHNNKSLEAVVKSALNTQSSKRLKILGEREPFSEINGDRRQSPNRKAAKKSNLVNNKHSKSKRNKKQGLKMGKHVGMAGKRGS